MDAKSMMGLLAMFLLGAATGCAGPTSDEPVVVGVHNGGLEEKSHVLTTHLWANPSNIPVCWETAGFTHEKQVVRDAVKSAWEIPESSVRFSGWGDCTAGAPGIHIVAKLDPEGPHVKDFGRALDGMAEGMVLDLALEGETFWNCHRSQAMRDQCNRGIAAHEFGHALGFLHEHERVDTPNSCPDKRPGFTDGVQSIGAWDLMSIMNYCFPDRFEVHPDKLSALDKKGLIQMYPQVAAPPPAVEEKPGGPTPASVDEDDTTGDDEDSDEDEDDDDVRSSSKKKKRARSRSAVTTGGCSTTPSVPSSADRSWLLGLGLGLAAMNRRRGRRTAA